MNVVEFDYCIGDWVEDDFGNKGKITMLGVDHTNIIMYSVETKRRHVWKLPEEIKLINAEESL